MKGPVVTTGGCATMMLSGVLICLAPLSTRSQEVSLLKFLSETEFSRALSR